MVRRLGLIAASLLLLAPLSAQAVDADHDGYAATSDCDDSNNRVYPGISVQCQVTVPNDGTKTCQGPGYTACTTTPLCEATGSGHCYYFDPSGGNDSNPGTYASKKKSLLQFVTYYQAGDQPAGYLNTTAGDVYYLFTGTFADTFLRNGDKVANWFLNRDGTASNRIVVKAYPGQTPVLQPTCSSLDRCSAFYLEGSDYWTIEGLNVTGTATGNIDGVSVYSSASTLIRNNTIHDVEGVEDDNGAGLYLSGATDTTVRNNTLYDNFERGPMSGPSDSNDTQIVTFLVGGTTSFLYNDMYVTAAISDANSHSGCLKDKHGTNTATGYQVIGNSFRNCAHQAIGVSTKGTIVRDNLVRDSYRGVYGIDFGGTNVTYLQDVVIESNTWVNTQIAVQWETSTADAFNALTYRKNVFSDNHASYVAEFGVWTMETYGGDAAYNAFFAATNLVASQNCYYNSNAAALRFDVYAGSPGTTGRLDTLAQWQGRGFDTDAVTTNPSLDGSYVAQSAGCAAYGWQVPTATAGRSVRGYWSRHGRVRAFKWQ